MAVAAQTRNENSLVEELAEARAQAARSNAALDELAHAVSHDLRAPLRAINTFSEWLERDLQPHLSGETAEYMRLLRSRTQHLDTLINGMLAFARADREPGSFQTVDTAALVGSIAESLSPGNPRAVQCAAGMPTLTTQRAPLERVLSILIDNALRFGTSARVSAIETDAHVEFAVADDGPGIPERLHERIWLLFQSAQPPGTEGSTGVGLAIARKIVERRGCRIWVDPDTHTGAAFRFTWPKDPVS